jgi:uroporphyrinogen decarboxylase
VSKLALKGRERFRRACLGEPVDRAPVWLMRQAGRYLPEYRKLRAETGFLEMVATPDLAVEISLQPWRRFSMDGVVVFADIMTPLGGTKLDVDFNPGPRIGNPIQSERDLALLDGDPVAAMQPTCEAIARIRSEVGERAAVLGFAGAPWTLAAYAMETQLTRDVVGLTTASYREPAFCDRLLERMAEICAASLRAQFEAGADAVQIFDTWAGLLSAERFRRFAGRALGSVLEQLGDDRGPVILYAREAAHLVDELAALGPDVISLDWRTNLGAAADRVGKRVSLQGNLDPMALSGPVEQIAEQVRAIREQGQRARGHILNLGHGVPRTTPVEGVAAFVEAALQSSRS